MRASRVAYTSLVLGGGHGRSVGLGKVGPADVDGALIVSLELVRTRWPSPSALAGALVSGHPC